MHRRALIRALGVLGLLACGAVAVPAQVPYETFVAAPDGTLLATDVYVPVGHGWGPWPVILQRTPYGKRSAMSRDTCVTMVLQGFACVAQDVRGRGASGGSNTVFRDDAGDGRATVEWIARQRFCDGKVGTFGGSALGITEYALAPAAPPELRCQLAAVATADFFHHAAFAGGALRFGLTHEWLAGQDALSFLDELRAHRTYDAWWREVEILPRASEVDIAGYHLGGWYDVFLQGTLDAYEALQHRGGPGAAGRQHLRVGPWTHMGLGLTQAGDLTYPANAGDPTGLLGTFRDYFMFHLMGRKPGVGTWPPVRIYLMGASQEPGAPGNLWLDLEDWPPPAVPTAYYLRPEGSLDREPGPAGSLRLLADPASPVPTRGGSNLYDTADGLPQGIGPMDQTPIEDRPDVAVFTTNVLGTPLTLIGRIRVHVWVRPDTPDLDIAVRLTDVYPDGRSMLVQDGIARARMRCGDEQECLATPGQPVELEVDLWSTALVVNAGHRVRVIVSGSNFPRFEVNPNTGGDLSAPATGVVAHPELLLGGDYPTRLELPVYRPEHQPRRRLTPRTPRGVKPTAPGSVD